MRGAKEFVASADTPAGKRTLAILELATTQDEEQSATTVAIDLIFAAASLMVSVHLGSGRSGHLCPPMQGHKEIDGALHAVSELAAFLIVQPEAEKS